MSPLDPVPITKSTSADRGSKSLSQVASNSTSRTSSTSSSLSDKSYSHPRSSPPSSPHFDHAFLGTPFALERPYEYPFPSPASESFPAVALSIKAPYNHVLATSTNSDTPPTLSSTGLVNAAFSLSHRVHPPTSYVRPSASILTRRFSSSETPGRKTHSPTSSTIPPSMTLPLNQIPPVPPGLLGRDAGPLSPRSRVEALPLWRTNPKPDERKA